MMKYFSILILFAAVTCKKQDADPSTQVQTLMNVSYGSMAAQKMDIYLPANRSTTNTGLIILIHGGAWSSGDKSDFNPYVDTLKRRFPDFAIANINYRLSANGTANLFPSQEEDVKSAVEFLYNKRNEYRFSDRFTLIGASAGGHLALLQGYKYTSPVKIRAIIDFFGPADMVDLYNNPASPLIPSQQVALIVGATPASNPSLYAQSSPINFINAQSTPTLILQGGLDPLVSPSQSIALRDKLQLNGVPHEYNFYPMEGHGWVGTNLAHSFGRIDAFINLYGR